MPKFPARTGVVVVAVVLILVAVVIIWRHASRDDIDGWRGDGPVRMPFTHGYVVRYDVGDVFTDGMERILLSGDQPGVLRRVEMTGPDADHFRVVGILLAGPHRKVGSYQVVSGFPPDVKGLGTLVSAEGADLATGKVGSLLLIGLEVVKPGLAIRTGVRLYYTVGDEKYTLEYQAAIANCPREMTIGRCQRAYRAQQHA
ncbi:MAG: hypothetical protein QM714_07525 [Nocardioides sp.]|uniref:hypothetical protein n=1 Tax=Nocardioides sp. TaxID=35761 RepID=UPI0039E6A526